MVEIPARSEIGLTPAQVNQPAFGIFQWRADTVEKRPAQRLDGMALIAPMVKPPSTKSS